MFSEFIIWTCKTCIPFIAATVLRYMYFLFCIIIVYCYNSVLSCCSKIVSNLPIELKHEWKTKFVSDFVEPLRTAYHVVLKKQEYSSISSRGNDWSTTVIEVPLYHYYTMTLSLMPSLYYVW